MSKLKNIKNKISIISSIIKKNFKLLMRSKSSALIIILGPILIMLVIGLAFNTSGLYDIKVGVFSESYTDASNSIINKLEDKEFKVVKTNSATSCIEDLKEGKFHICIVLPSNLDITKDIQKDITFHIDYSRINLVWIILDIVSSRVSEQSSAWSLNLTVEILDELEETKYLLNQKKQFIDTSIENTNEISSKSNDMSKNLKLLDTKFNIKESSFGELKEEINNLIYKNNESTDNTKDLRKELNNFEAELIEVESKFKDIEDVITSTGEDLSNIRSTALANKENLKEIKDAIKTINLNIDSIDVKNASNIVNPITTSIRPIESQKNNIDYIASTLIILIIMFISVLLASITIISERTSKAYFRMKISSTKELMFNISTYLTIMIITSLQLIIIMLIASLFLDIPIISNILNILIILAILSTFFTLTGMLIGYLFNSKETSILASISFSSILLFFSNTILPIENMTTAIKKVALFNPFVIGHNTLNKTLLFQSSIDTKFYYMLVYIVVICIGILVIQKIKKERLND